MHQPVLRFLEAALGVVALGYAAYQLFNECRDDMHAVRCIKRAALVPREGSRLELQVVDAIPHDARFVLIGEASHGTHVSLVHKFS